MRAPRPGTGLARPPTSSLGGGFGGAGVSGGARQVADSGYFLERVRAKTREVEDETERLNDAVVRAEAEAETSEKVRRRRDGLAAEVDALRARLADGNVALDAVSSGDVARARADLDAKAREARSRNADAKAAAAAAETARSQALAEAARLESQCGEHADAIAARIARLPPAARAEFEALEAERARLEETRGALEGDLEATAEAVAELERGVAADPRKRRALALRESLESLEAKKAALAEARARVSLSPEEQRARLKEQIKADTAATKEAEAETAALRDAARAAEARLAEARDAKKNKKRAAAANANDAHPRSGGTDGLAPSEADAFVAGPGAGPDVERDEELAAFVDAFESNAARAAEAQAKSRREIRELLEKTCEALKGESSPTSASPTAESSSVSASEAAEAEQMEGKIADELRALAERSAKMRSALASFGDAEEIRKDQEKVKKGLERDKAAYSAREDALHLLVRAEEREKLRRETSGEGETPAAKALAALQRKIEIAEGANHAAKMRARKKDAELNDGAVWGEIDAMVAELNGLLKSRAAAA